jgi:hypothetical protein
MAKREDPNAKSTFTFEEPEPGTLTLAGALDGRQIVTKLHKVEDQKFLLTNRGFHWINEYPYNR